MRSVLIESLENRLLLSSGSWPAAPFAGNDLRATIYVNQNGDALVKRQSPVGLFNGYNLFYDDPGPLSMHTSGAATELAFYSRSGRPTSVDASGGTGQLDGHVPEEKRMQYVGVRPGGSGKYRLRIDGPRATFIEKIAISKVRNAGASGSDISGEGDFDFYQFTLPRSGNWVVKAIPDPERIPLNATLNVYNAHGKAVGGRYTRTINKGGPGLTEQWTGVGLSAGASLFARVDGAGTALGGYGISVSLALGPDVSIAAVDPYAGRLDGLGRFKVIRTDNSNKPLTLHYRISGTARPGLDYQSLSQFVIIPQNRLWASIVVNPLAAAERGTTVVLTLLPAEGFSLYPLSRARVTIR
jgi:hypothetical protein